MKVKIVTWRDSGGAESVVGVFDDEELANRTYDTLVAHGDENKQYYLDDYTLNEINERNKK